MKKVSRLLALLLCAFLCLSLSGCGYLDQIRQQQGFWQINGTILWNDTTYRLLDPHGETLNLKPDQTPSLIYVTETDVPVLLSYMLGESFDVCNGKLILAGPDDSIYCQDVYYVAIVNSIARGFELDTICYDYIVIDEDGWYASEATYCLTEKEKAELMTLYDLLEPVVMEDGMYLSVDNYVHLYGLNENGLLRKELFKLSQADDRYYIEDEESIYLIPEEKNALIKTILQHKSS